jgi:hypothetical protein
VPLSRPDPGRCKHVYSLLHRRSRRSRFGCVVGEAVRPAYRILGQKAGESARYKSYQQVGETELARSQLSCGLRFMEGLFTVVRWKERLAFLVLVFSCTMLHVHGGKRQETSACQLPANVCNKPIATGSTQNIFCSIYLSIPT